MEIQEEDIILIESYVAGELSKAEAIQRDRDFEEKLQLYQTSLEAIEAWGDAQLKAKLKGRFEGNSSPKVIPMRSIWRWAVAASVLLLASLIIWQMFKPKAFDLDQAFAQNYVKMQPPISQFRDTQESDSLLNISLSSYERGNHSQSLELLRKITPKDSVLSTEEKYSFMAYNFMELGQWDSSIYYLSTIPSSFPNFMDTQWQLALSYIKNDQLGQAEKVLNMLSEQSNTYRQKANDLLRQLKK